jgi:phosphoserine aminotransferase
VFAIYVVLLVTRWLINDIGGVAHGRDKLDQGLMYRMMDSSDGFYRGRLRRGPLGDE